MQSSPSAKETMLADERLKQIAQLESEIEAKSAEIDQLRIDDLFEEGVEEDRDESNDPAANFDSAFREDSFGEIIVLWETPVADEDRGGLKKIAIGKEHDLSDGSPRRSTDVKTPPDMVYATSYESEETSVESAEDAPNPPSPRSPAGFFEHLLRPFGSPGTKDDAPIPASASPRDTVGFADHLLIPLSPGSESESSAELEALRTLVDERDRKIKSLRGTVSSDTEVMRKMKAAIERLSVELLSARESEKMFRALGSRSSSLEDEIEELRVENTKLRISCQMLEEEKRRVEREMRTELDLLHLESDCHARCFG